LVINIIITVFIASNSLESIESLKYYIDVYRKIITLIFKKRY